MPRQRMESPGDRDRGVLDWVRAYIRRVFVLDLRSLAAMRIGLGVVVLFDLAIRAVDLTAMYTDAGVLPRADRVFMYGKGWAYSIYDLGGANPTVTTLLFATAALAAVAMILGIGTRVAIAVCWLSALGLRLRMPLATTGGDVLLVALLLWSSFLPMDARWSLAARWRERVPREPIYGLAPFALMLQVGVVFVFAGSAKLWDPAWRAGDGVYYALTAELYTTGVAAALLDVAPGWLLAVMTYGVVLFEIAGPLALLIPRRQALLRSSFVWSCIAMNVCFWLCLRIGIFSWVAVMGCVALLPGSFWDWAAAKIRKSERPASPIEPRWYRLPKPIAAVLVALLALMMINNIRVPRYFKLKKVARVSTQIGLDQRGWPMFSPTARDHGWFLLVGRQVDGTERDLYRDGAAPSFARPKRLSAEFATYRRRKYFMNLKRGAQHARDRLLRYHCRRWNRAHADREAMESISLIYMREVTLPDYKTTPAQRIVLAVRKC